MSADARTRAELEAAQVERRRLEEALARAPDPAKQGRLQRDVGQLEVEIATLDRDLAVERGHEIAHRDARDRDATSPWWRSGLAPFAGLAMVAAGFWLSVKSLDFVDWEWLAPRAGPVLPAGGARAAETARPNTPREPPSPKRDVVLDCAYCAILQQFCCDFA